jgi:hypothetical protein
MDLKKYLERFKSIIGALTGALAVLPLLSEVLPGKAGDYAFPPLGTFQLFWIVLSVAVAAAIILLIYYFARGSSYVSQHDRRVKIFILVGAFAGLGILAYFVAVQLVVRELWIPTESKGIAVSVGFHRTEFADKEFSGKSDWEMLETMGFEEEQIRKLWTVSSILVARTLLFAAYLWTLSMFIALGSFAVLCDVYDNP